MTFSQPIVPTNFVCFGTSEVLLHAPLYLRIDVQGGLFGLMQQLLNILSFKNYLLFYFYC